MNAATEAEPLDALAVTGARVHNLKNINVTIPHGRLTVITGLSGSGKSSLAFDTIFAEGQRRYIETFSSYARQMLGTLERPDVDRITGLSPVIAIEQKTINRNPAPRSEQQRKYTTSSDCYMHASALPGATSAAIPWSNTPTNRSCS